MKGSRPSIAFWFRYGAAEHAELFHALPDIIRLLARDAEVHYFGPRTRKAVPAVIQDKAILHLLPYSVDRRSDRDRVIKTILWYMLLPWLGLRCRMLRVQAVYIDETLPLTPLLARIFFGPQVAVTVADFFLEAYWGQHPLLSPITRLIGNVDLPTWRRLPLLFTRAQSARDYLAARGCSAERIVPVYDTCDLSLYRPMDRGGCRREFQHADEDIVLVYHGILHPNKGLDLVINALPGVLAVHPRLRLLLIGDGPEMEALQKLTRDLGLESNVRFTGYMEPARVAVALNASDIGLVSRLGTTGDRMVVTSVLGHCMACGLPVLAANMPGIAEVVREDGNGFLYEPRDARDFQEKLCRLAADPALRMRLGQQGIQDARRVFVEQASAERTAQPLLQLARKALPARAV